MLSMRPSGKGVGLKITRSGVRFPLLIMCKSLSLYCLCHPSSDGYLVGGNEWIKLSAYLYDVCAVCSQGR